MLPLLLFSFLQFFGFLLYPVFLYVQYMAISHNLNEDQKNTAVIVMVIFTFIVYIVAGKIWIVFLIKTLQNIEIMFEYFQRFRVTFGLFNIHCTNRWRIYWERIDLLIEKLFINEIFLIKDCDFYLYEFILWLKNDRTQLPTLSYQ